MRTRLKSFLLLSFLGISALSYSQTATWTKNFADEGEIRTETDNEIVVTLTGAETFTATIETDDGEASTFVGGMTGYSSKWGAILSGLTATNITLSGGGKIATIAIPQSTDYYITEDDVIGFTIPIASHSGASAITCSSDLTISNLETTVSPSGDLAGGTTETAIRAGSNTLVFTLTNNKWVPGIATTTERLDTIKDMFSGASEFGEMVTALTTGDISVNVDSTELTITFPATSDYYLTADEDINIEARQHLLQYSEAYVDSTSSFTISDAATTVALGGDLISSADETDIRGGSNTLTLTLTNNKWVPGIATTTERLDTIKDMFSGASEFGTLVTALTTGDISVNGDSTVLTVTFPAKSDYYLTADENINVEARQHLLQYSEQYSDSTHSFTVSNVAPSITYGGDLHGGITESVLRSGGQTYTLTLDGNFWDTDIETETAERDLVRGMFSNSTTFGPLALALVSGDLDVSGDQKTLTITFPEKADYFIPSNDVVTVTPHQDLLTDPEAYSSTSTTFTITNEEPIIFITNETFTEQDVRDGNSFTITLRGDIWVDQSSLSSTFKDRVSAGASEWNNEIQSNLVITRTNDSIITVSWASNSYEISSSETVTITSVLHEDLVNTDADVTSISGAKTITAISATVVANLEEINVDEGDIRDPGTHTITLDLNEDTWVAGVGSNGADDITLRNSITCSPPSSDWDDLIALASVSSPDANEVVTVTIPQDIDFDIVANITLSFTPPASLFTLGSSVSDLGFDEITRIVPFIVLTSDPTAPLTEADIKSKDKAFLIATLHEVTFTDDVLNKSNFTILTNPLLTGDDAIKVDDKKDDLTYIADDQVKIKIKVGPKFNIDENVLLGLEIKAAELVGTEDLTIAPELLVGSLNDPFIENVVMDDVPMGIDDVITATLTLTDDTGEEFTYLSGMIAGREPDSLFRVNSTTYEAYFTIVENSLPEYAADDSIKIDSLHLMNVVGVDTIIGNFYDTTLVGTNDLIDTRRPIVDLIDIEDGDYKVGDVITALVHANEAGLSFVMDSTTINGLNLNQSNVDYNEIGSGIYELIYTVENGNPNADPIPVYVVMKDIVNESEYYDEVAGVTTIDATQPGIISAEITSSGAQTPDSIINISIVSTEVGLFLGEGSHVNNVSSPAQLDLTFVTGFTYNLAYTVGQDDDELLSEGIPESTIILVDGNGNEVTLTNGLTGNNITIITTDPTASIYGGGSICPGETMELFVNLVGDAPFSMEVSNGPDTETFTNITENPFGFFVTPGSPGSYTYTVTEIKDKYEVIGLGIGASDVTLHEAAEADIVEDRTSFQVSEQGYELKADFPRPGVGSFSGVGVVSTESMFYPNLAGITDSTAVFYDFEETATGCTTRDTVKFSVVKQTAELSVPDYICYDSNDTIVEGENLAGTAGYLRLYEVIGNIEIEKENAIDSISSPGTISKARILATTLSPGVYRVKYFYKYGGDTLYSNIGETFILDYINEVEFLKPADDEFEDGYYIVCNNEETKELKTNLDSRPDGTFEWLETIDNGVGQDPDTEKWQYKPKQAKVGLYSLYYTYTSSAGCTQTADFEVINNKVPELGFKTNTLCISAEGGPIQFIDTTDIGPNINPVIVNKWNWNFGDGEATVNDNNYETYDPENPIHNYSSWGKKIVTLTTEGGYPGFCVATIEKEIDLAVTPISNFGWNSDCYLSDVDVDFDNKTEYGTDVESYLWRITEEDGTIIHDDTTTIREDSLMYPFPKMQNYNIRLISVTDIGCADTITRLLKLKETVSLKDADYFESFNQSDGRWSSDVEVVNGNNTWTYAEPTFEGFSPSSGDLAWFTNLTPAENKDKDVDYSERSWMQSPCFDFRGTDRPMIRMDIMKSFDEYSDGAVLQYTINDGETWTTVGSRDQGISWYNYSDIFETPGGKASSIGWSGDEIAEIDSVWETAAIDLDELIDEETVIFGIFFATNGSSRARNDGFAFDNIYVGERTKRALIEHFTNSGSLFAENADAKIDDFTSSYELDVTSLQYHMHYPGLDEMNENNSSPGSSRSFYYGVSSLPYALMDGGTLPSYVYDDVENVPPTAVQLKELTLEDPLFELDVAFQLYDERLSANVDLKALKDLDSMDVILNVAVVEKTVKRYTGSNGDTEFKNVVLSMLPDAAGLLYSKAWDRNEAIDTVYSWTYMGDVDTSEVMIVAFVQDRETDKVLQVASEDDPKFVVSIPKYNFKSINLYPNPARNELYVVFSEPVSADGVIEVTDMTGRTVLLVDIYGQDQKVRLDIGELKEGSYILRTKENGSVTRRANFIKVR